MEKEIYYVTLSLRIDWSEMDLFGHVNNVMFMKYIQAARVNYWDKIGLSGKPEKTAPMLASTSCQFHKPLYYPGNIIIKTRTEFVKNTSFGLKHLILNQNNEICATGNDVLVTFDFTANEKITVPDWLRKNIELVEKGKTLN